MVIYYAHCMAIYNTPQENRDVELLESIVDGGVVWNPNNPVTSAQCDEMRKDFNCDPYSVGVPGWPGSAYQTASDAVMDRIFKPLAQGCTLLAFRGLPDGTIPSGVAQEIQWATDAGIPVIELPCAVKRRTLTLDQTRDYLKEIGHR